MKWFVIRDNINTRRIETFNVFDHGGFRDDVISYLKKCETREEFAENLRRSLFYYFWCKSEWEVVVSPLIGGRDAKDLKIDVYWQVMNNWDIFVDYVWRHKK